MSAEERLQLKGRLYEARQKESALKTRIRALKGTIRAALDPYKDPLETDVLGAADQMKLLLEAHQEYAQVTALIESLKKDLGE